MASRCAPLTYCRPLLSGPLRYALIHRAPVKQVEVLGAKADELNDQWFTARVLGTSSDLLQVVYNAARAILSALARAAIGGEIYVISIYWLR